MQNKVVRFILDTNNRFHIGQEELSRVSMLKFADRVTQLKLSHVFKISKEIAPQYLQQHFTKLQNHHTHNTRNRSSNLFVPQVNSQTIHTFYFTAIKDWNSLPEVLKQCNSIPHFKSSVKRYLTDRAKAEEENQYYIY